MAGSKSLGRGIHLFVLVEEPSNILGQFSILGIAGGIERSGGLPRANMTIPCGCHFAQRSAGRSTPCNPLRQTPATVRSAYRSLLKRMVRAAGIEPALLSEQDFESLLNRF